MLQTINGYLLTRSWRDTAKGVDLVFWAATDSGPVHIIIEHQQPVCFVEQNQIIDLPPGVRRSRLDLRMLGAGAVDGLYFRQQRDLKAFRQIGIKLGESDVKPTDRYLMERFICAGFEAKGQVVLKQNTRSMFNPQLRATAVQPTLTALSLDIETRGNSQQLYSIAGAWLDSGNPSTGTACSSSTESSPDNHNAVFIIGTATDTQRDGYQLHYCIDERTLLQAFFKWLAAVDPDLIIGWAVVNFDLDFLDRKCRSLGISFALGRGQMAANILQPSARGQPRVARVPGRAVLDGIDLLKAGFWSFDSFSLENVAKQLLGEGKLITPEQDKVGEINRLFRNHKPTLADYNFRDCTLVNEIFIKANLIQFAIQRANLTGLALDRLGGSVAAFDNLYLPRLHRRGFVAPDVDSSSDGLGSPGGYVMDSMPGLYENVLVLDFKSLYPSIIRTFFIDPLGLTQPGDNPVPGYLDANFSRDNHILPQMIEELWAARDTAKQAKNDALSQAIKIIMNSFYGVLGTNGCRFHSQQLASSITRRGHDIITRSRDQIEAKGYLVIYGDTDSLFVLLGKGHTADSATQIGNRLMAELNNWWQSTLKQDFQIESHLEVEFETHYTRFLMPTIRGMPTGSKKRYAGLIMDSNQSPYLIVKGLEAARTDWTPLAREFQRELFRRVFLDLPYKQFVIDTASALQSGAKDNDLVYRKRLRRRLDDYQRNVPPHVQAARKLTKAGNWVSYVITRNGPEPVELLSSAPNYEHYLEKQLAPAADGILQFLDTSFSAITDAQMQMF